MRTVRTALRRTGLGVAIALVAGGLATFTSASGAESATPFVAAGTVTSANAPIDPTPAEGQSVAFIIDDLTEVSPSAADRLASPTGPMKVNATPTTQYFKLNTATGNYERSTYAGTIVQGDEVRVSGRYVDGANGTTFLANYVWNPPTTPAPSGGASPGCTKVDQGTSARPFLVAARVATTTALVPCTGFGGSPLGFTLGNPYTQMTPGFDQALIDYGGAVRIYEISGWTRYIKNNAFSTRPEVVKVGNDVQVYGRYLHLNGGWIAVATYVWSPPPTPSSGNVTVSSTVEAQSTDGTNYTGAGTSFRSLELTLTWAPNGANWTFAGTYTLLSNEGSRLEGTVTGGTVNNGVVSASLSVTVSSGAYAGMSGTGTLTGNAVPSPPGVPPNGFVGTMNFVLN